MFLAIVFSIFALHHIGNVEGYPINANKNPHFVAEYRVNE